MDIVISFILCIIYVPMVTEAGFRSSLHLKMVFTGTMLSVHELLRNRVLLGPPPPLPSVMTKLAHTGSGKVWWIKGKTDQRPSDRKGNSSLLIPWKGRQNRKAGKELKTAYRLRGILFGPGLLYQRTWWGFPDPRHTFPSSNVQSGELLSLLRICIRTQTSLQFLSLLTFPDS